VVCAPGGRRARYHGAVNPSISEVRMSPTVSIAPASLAALALRLRTLAVFRSLLADPVLRRLLAYLDVRQNNAPLHACVAAWGDFVAELYATSGVSLAAHVQSLVNDDENPYIRAVGRGEQPPQVLADAVASELRVLQAVADLTPEALREGLAWSGPLPGFEVSAVDIAGEYAARTAAVGRYGYGMYARYTAFFLNAAGAIEPVRHPDSVRLADLVDYRHQQEVILANTRALLEGKPAANILLTGDAGTGKSSTVKAVANELADQGLRILEVRKDQLQAIPAVLDELTANPLTFVLFIDDLSFQAGDDTYAALKAILEGGVAAKSRNVAIYATSNRRHLVKERFSDRDGDDVHRNDSMQEALSLSERFGIQLTFQKPDKATYLDIVHHLAVEAGALAADGDTAQIDAEAERFALGRGGRSARAARQFVDGLVARD
jgi:hypothetical protein